MTTQTQDNRLLNYFSLFTSFGTLICCARPSLLVLLGLGATVASFLTAAPWLITLSQHKIWVFAISGTLIGANFLYVFVLAPKIKANSPWQNSAGPRYERHRARCEAPRRRRCSPIGEEWQRGRWPDAAVTLWAQGGSGHRLCRSSVTMKEHRSAPHFAPVPRRPLRATLQSSATGC